MSLLCLEEEENIAVKIVQSNKLYSMRIIYLFIVHIEDIAKEIHLNNLISIGLT